MRPLPTAHMPTGAPFKLREVVVEPDIGVIEGPGGTAHLEPRVVAVLRFLASRPKELVTRSELLAEIWPGTDIYDDALTQSVYQLRQQLVSAGGDPSYKDLISTVPKRGYVLKEDPLPAIAAAATPVEAPIANVATRSRGLRSLWAAIPLFFVMAAAYYQWERTNAELPGPQVVAVLPFLPLTEAQRDPALELGMADTLIARLSQSDQIVVRPMTSVRMYGELDRDSLQAGSELSADAVVDGSIQHNGSHIRINVRLVRVSDGVALWADTFNELFSDIFTIQGEISRQIADALALPLGRQVRVDHAGTSNVDAYQSYLAGRYRLYRLTPADLRASVASFREAVTLDPNYAQAWVGLASALFRSPLGGEVPPRNFYPEAKAAAEKAIALDDSLAEAHAMRGWIAFWYEWDWAMSESYFKHAIALNPHDTESHLGYAHLLANTGRFAQAVEEARRAREISPFFMMAAVLEARWLSAVGRLDEAQKQLERARDLDPNFWHTRVELSDVYWRQGSYKEALQEAELARSYSGDATWAVVTQLGVLVRAGRTAEAAALRDMVHERAKTRYVPPYDLAISALALSDADAALAWLEKGFEARDPKMTFIGVEERWDGIRTRPEFIAILRRMNLLGLNAGAPGRVSPVSIQAGPIRFIDTGGAPMVAGSFQVSIPKSGTGSEATLPQGGACLIADLVQGGVGLPTCVSDADCNPAGAGEAGGVRLDGSRGYCISRNGEDSRCWTRPAPADAYCKRSVSGFHLIPGRHELGPVSADPLGRGAPYPTWAVLACMAQAGHERACGNSTEREYRQMSVTWQRPEPGARVGGD